MNATVNRAPRLHDSRHTNAGLASRFVLVSPRPLRPQLRGQIARRAALAPSPVSPGMWLRVVTMWLRCGPRPVTGQSRRCASRVTSLLDHRHGGIVIGIVGVAPSRRAARPVPCPPRHLLAISVPISGREIRRWRPQELRSRRVRRPRRRRVRHRSHAFLRRGRHAVLQQASCPRRHRDPPIPRHPRYV